MIPKEEQIKQVQIYVTGHTQHKRLPASRLNSHTIGRMFPDRSVNICILVFVSHEAVRWHGQNECTLCSLVGEIAATIWSGFGLEEHILMIMICAAHCMTHTSES